MQCYKEGERVLLLFVLTLIVVKQKGVSGASGDQDEELALEGLKSFSS